MCKNGNRWFSACYPKLEPVAYLRSRRDHRLPRLSRFEGQRELRVSTLPKGDEESGEVGVSQP
jgi:hypothetical protein